MPLSDREMEAFFRVHTPYSNTERALAVRANRQPLAHYTSAENALKILRSREVWLRKASVHYSEPTEFVGWFDTWSHQIMSDPRSLELSAESLVALICNAFRLIALCTKHPGFKEEREWRVFHSDQGLVGVAIPALIRQVIIGPMDHPLPVWEAFVDELNAAGVPQSAERVLVSDIPLRQ